MLFLLYADEKVSESSPPEFFLEWLEKRVRNEQKKKNKNSAELTEEEIAKREKAKAKRAAEREKKVAEGLQELELWVRRGLANTSSQPMQYWEKMSKRLIDAQAPNVARLVRKTSSAVYKSGESGVRMEKLLEQAGKIFLLCKAYKRLGEFPEMIQADIKTAVGFTFKEDELKNAEIVADEWKVQSVRVFEEDKLRLRRVWLYG